MQASVLPADTVGIFCQRHGLSREALFALNPHLNMRSFYIESGILTAVLDEGEQLRTSVGVGAAPAVTYCQTNEGQGGWQKMDGRWYYANHTGLTLSALANRYGTDVMTIWKGSRSAGTIPTTWLGKTVAPAKIGADNPPVFYPSGTNLKGLSDGDRVLFWMPDAAIEKAYADGCIVEKGDLGGPKPLVASSGLTVKCQLNDGNGGWQIADDGRWYYVHYENLLLGDLAEVYLGSSSRAKEIFAGSQSRGLLPPGSTVDNVPVTAPYGRTFFWMPDDAIVKAYNLGCIPDVGQLTKPKPVAPDCAGGAKPIWSEALNQWDCPKPCTGGRLFAKDGLTCVCPEGTTPTNPADPQSSCKALSNTTSCPENYVFDPATKTCKPVKTNPTNTDCPVGMTKNTLGDCVAATCPKGQEMNLKGQCVSKKNPQGNDKPSSETQESSSIWPWILLGVAVVGGGGYMMYSASKKDALKKPEEKNKAQMKRSGTPETSSTKPGSTQTASTYKGGYPSAPPPGQPETVFKINPVGMPTTIAAIQWW